MGGTEPLSNLGGDLARNASDVQSLQIKHEALAGTFPLSFPEDTTHAEKSTEKTKANPAGKGSPSAPSMPAPVSETVSASSSTEHQRTVPDSGVTSSSASSATVTSAALSSKITKKLPPGVSVSLKVTLTGHNFLKCPLLEDQRCHRRSSDIRGRNSGCCSSSEHNNNHASTPQASQASPIKQTSGQRLCAGSGHFVQQGWNATSKRETLRHCGRQGGCI